MGRRALRTLACMRLAHRLASRCRCHAVGRTHSTTVKVTTDNNDLSPPGHSVSLLHAHLVLVTKYRHPVFTDEMLTFTDTTTRAVCADLDVELVESNGETDHVHLLVAYPPTLAISVLVQRLKGRTAYAVRREYTGVCVRARMRGHLLVAVLLRGLPRRGTAIDHQAIHRRPSPTTRNAGLRPPTYPMG